MSNENLVDPMFAEESKRSTAQELEMAIELLTRVREKVGNRHAADIPIPEEWREKLAKADRLLNEIEGIQSKQNAKYAKYQRSLKYQLQTLQNRVSMLKMDVLNHTSLLQVAVALAHMTERVPVSFSQDQEKGQIYLYLSLPTGQVGFLIPRSMQWSFKAFEGLDAGAVWDGHTSQDKEARIEALMAALPAMTR